MRSLVVYSSRTGNTKKVAEAIFQILPYSKILSSIEEAPLAEGFDFVALGFWVDRGYPDAQTQHYMRTLQGKQVGLFGTLGSLFDIDYVVSCLQRAKDLLKQSTILGSFLCQGKIAPEAVELITKTHRLTPTQLDRISEAERHPDPKDLSDAQEIFKTILTKL